MKRMAHRLLVAIDHDVAVPHVVAAVTHLFAGVAVEATVVHVRERQPRGVALLSRTDAERLIDRMVSALGKNGMRARGRLQASLPGCVAAAIIEVAEQEDASAIVVGTYRRSGLARWLQGSVSRRVIRNAPIPVFIVPLGRWRADDRDAVGIGDDAPQVVALNFKARLRRPHEPVA